MSDGRISFRSYYLGLPEAGGLSFRDDIRALIPADRMRSSPNGAQWGWLCLDVFWKGGRGDFLGGRRRTMCVIACYYTVLIDQMIHSSYPDIHPRFELLTSPPKLMTTIFHVHPWCLISRECLQDDRNWWDVYTEATPVFEQGLLEFAKKHFPGFDAKGILRKLQNHHLNGSCMNWWTGEA